MEPNVIIPPEEYNSLKKDLDTLQYVFDSKERRLNLMERELEEEKRKLKTSNFLLVLWTILILILFL